MKPSNIAKLGVIALGFVCGAYAQDAAAPAANPAKAATAPVAPKDPESNKVRVSFDDAQRQIVAYYSNASQARLKVYAVNRYDAEIAKPRVYFIAEMTGTAVVEPVKLDADDAASIDSVVKLLARFDSEAKKSDKLKESMEKKKAAAEAELSRQETKLVDLQSNQSASADELAAAKKSIDALRAEVVLADDLSKMEKIAGSIGKAKINIDRPAYDFQVSFEPAKKLYTLNAGYSFQVDSSHAEYYLDLLKHVQDYKQQLLDHESASVSLREAVDGIFKEDAK